ncbi:alpha/beta hydrolase [Sphingomicrobium sp. XHP0239]|uniref:alpha/beta hydrolase family protein n=1 Tax=Sphingomicrobium maritimum TaxID=3133972 RepID=UPI0031CC4A57
MMRLLLLSIAALLALPAAAQSEDRWIYEETHRIVGIDQRNIQFYLDWPADGSNVPILLMIDGSGCVGQLRERGRSFYRPGPDAPFRYARLQIEKPGVDPTADFFDALTCSDEFHRHYTIANRVADHLRVLQHLGAQADWWNGDLYLWGWSDGGDIGAQLLSYRPTTTRAVLGAMGGGFTMAEHFEDFWVCPEETTSDRPACLADLRADFTRIADHLSRVGRWNGESPATWDSRLHSRLIAPLADNRVPLLIVHGEQDFDSVPVASARRLVDGLREAGNRHFAYWEIAGMEHGWSSLPPGRKASARLGMYFWLFDLPIPPELMPSLTERSIPALPLADASR